MQEPLVVSQNSVLSRQSEFCEQPARSWQKPAALQN
jgi:hypothetical protein